MWTIEIDSIARENTGFMVEVDFKYQFAEYIIFKQDGILGYEWIYMVEIARHCYICLYFVCVHTCTRVYACTVSIYICGNSGTTLEVSYFLPACELHGLNSGPYLQSLLTGPARHL